MSIALDRRDRDRLRAIEESLQVIRLDREPTLLPVIRMVRELLELEAALVYSVRNCTGRWELDRWDVAGMKATARSSMETVLSNTDAFPLYYNPIAPPPKQRNRVIDGVAWVQDSHPGTWERSPVVEIVLRPLRMDAYHQPRVLLCKGAALLGWFGGLDAKPPTRRQLGLLSRLVKPMRDRLDAEMRLFAAPHSRPALQLMLDRVGAPAFVIGETGAIEEANVAGRALVANRQRELRAKLVRATIGRESVDGIEIVPVQDSNVRAWVAILQGDCPDARVTRCVDACIRRWALTPRQADVLGHLVRGHANSTISTLLGCVERTVELHITAIFDRAGVESRAALVAAVLTSQV